MCIIYDTIPVKLLMLEYGLIKGLALLIKGSCRSTGLVCSQYSCKCGLIAPSWSIFECVSIDVLSNTGGIIAVLLMIEYRLIKELCLLEVAVV